MKTPKTILALSMSASVALSTINLAPNALAQELNEDIHNQNQIHETPIEENFEEKTQPPQEEINKNTSVEEAVKISSILATAENEKEFPSVTPKKDEEFLAHIYIHTKDGLKTISVKDSKNTVKTELDAAGKNVDNMRLSDGTLIDGEGALKNGDSLVLYSNYKDAHTQEVSIEPRVEYVDDPNMLIGTEIVESEGKPGKALETIVTTKSISTDEAKNKNAQKAKETISAAGETNEEKTLSVIETPEKKIIRKGTAEPAPSPSLASTSSSVGSSSGGSYTQTTTTYGAVGDGVVGANYSAEITELQSKTQNAAVQLALAQVGKPYVWGAVGPNAFDCSGLIYWIYKTNLGKNIPRIAGDQGAAATYVGWENAQPGDIIWLGNQHVGMYVGDGKMVHASTPERGVVLDNIGWAQAQGYSVGRFN